ncbi:hypothetical protein FHS82_001632 [Pseudochelatococcus lubricantis]|uniref:Uncharacterized protein n=1 Tax=Pseudochelatococcus lubricantis TaxID=1538102 RepID=A0ABX0UXZ0_9HYPH|nr:hypothetical protein [Pseudochelatococcus lubricantis]
MSRVCILFRQFVCRYQEAMRAEIENLIENVKQSVGLLRRHL